MVSGPDEDHRSTTAGPVPPSLLEADLAPVWNVVALRLEQRGERWRGTAQLPQLSARAQHVLGSLLGRRAGRQIQLDELERALGARGVGEDLVVALGRLGHPVAEGPAERRAARAVAAGARAASAAVVATWTEPWAARWWDGVAATGALRGMDATAATEFVASVRQVVDAVEQLSGSVGSSRTDLAATVLGDSHALDSGTRLNAALVRYFAAQSGADIDPALPMTDRDWWERVGAPTDLVSAPVLTWGLPLEGSGPVHVMVRSATAAGLPVHLSQMALRTDAPVVAADAVVYSVENPRLVEAAAQRRLPVAMLCTNGHPSMAVTLLVRLILDCGASVLHHGDFDPAGLAITARLHRLGVGTWRMSGDDYAAAVRAAEEQGVELPISDADVPETPWDPTVQREFSARRRVVHEERLMDQLFDELR